MIAGRSNQRAVVLGGSLIAIGLLAATGASTLLAWTDPCVPVGRYPALLGGYFVTWWLARRAASPGARRLGLLGGSLLCGAVFDPGFLLLTLVWLIALHRILFGAHPRRLARAVGFVAASTLAIGVVCNRDLWPGWLAAHGYVSRWGYVFAMMFTFRLAWLLHQVRVQGTAQLPLVDLLLYFLFAPFFVIVPYMAAIPRCDRFCAGLDRHDPDIERSGLRMIAWGIALALALAALRWVYDPRAAGRAAVAAVAYGPALVHGLAFYFVDAMLAITAIAAILVGLVRTLGIDLGPSFQRPLLARSVPDWWRRWNTHFRELLVDLFYYPVVMRYRRRPTLGVVLGCASVFLVGSVLFHFPKQYFHTGSLDAAVTMLFTLAECAVMTVLVAGALLREQRRPRAPRRRSWPAVALAMLSTYLLVFFAVVVVGYGAQYAWTQR